MRAFHQVVTKMASSSDVSDTGGDFMQPLTEAQRRAQRQARIEAQYVIPTQQRRYAPHPLGRETVERL